MNETDDCLVFTPRMVTTFTLPASAVVAWGQAPSDAEAWKQIKAITGMDEAARAGAQPPDLIAFFLDAIALPCQAPDASCPHHWVRVGFLGQDLPGGTTRATHSVHFCTRCRGQRVKPLRARHPRPASR